MRVTISISQMFFVLSNVSLWKIEAAADQSYITRIYRYVRSRTSSTEPFVLDVIGITVTIVFVIMRLMDHYYIRILRTSNQVVDHYCDC